MKTKFLALLITVSSMALFSCSKSSSDYGGTPNGGGGNNGSPNDISISGMSFPGTTTVKVGTTVTWTNNDATTHTVTSDDGSSFSSGNLDYGKSFSYKTNTAGTFAYHCNYHSNMKATLVVTQ